MTSSRLLILFVVCCSALTINAQTDLDTRTVISGLSTPWEILWGPDDHIWMTERVGLVSTVHPETGAKKELLNLRAVVSEQLEGGLLGMVLHPNFADSPYVYLAYVSWANGDFYKTVQRYTYHDDTLSDPIEIFRFAPASLFHQGCRLVIDEHRKLFITQGDSFDASKVQSDTTLYGKILRLNLDGSIPDDNPIPGNPMYTKGHRNPQGLVLMPNGSLLESEHGNDIDDEINIIEPGRNYGWPNVEGFCDRESEEEFCEENNVHEPLWASGGHTVATSGLTWYDHPRFPDLQHSLLETCLKASKMLQVRLDSSFTRVVSVRDWFPFRFGRLRDACVSPDGRIFICTSNRDGAAKKPFPRTDDDKILELVPVPANTRPVPAIVGDTARARCLVGDSTYFTIDVRNDGTAPMTVNNLWMHGANGQFYADLLTGVVEISAGSAFPMRCVFAPKVAGPIADVVVLHVVIDGEEKVFEFPAVGYTDVGVLRASVDTLRLPAMMWDTVTTSYTVTNVGTQPVVLHGLTISGPAASTVRAVFEGDSVIAPMDQRFVRVSLTPNDVGVLKAAIDTRSTGYSEPHVPVWIDAIPTSVHDDVSTVPMNIIARPNPMHDRCTITFTVPFDGVVTITSLCGETVAALRGTGSTTLSVDGSLFARGLYVVRADVAGEHRSVLLIRQ